MSNFKIVAVSGSLRKGSFNTLALRAAQQLAPAGVTIEIADISDLPMYNDDIRTEAYPEPCKRLRAQIAAADAVLFAIPEYNYAVSAPMKNAFDWVSRPPDQPLNMKAVGLMSASPGPLGGSACAVFNAPYARGDKLVLCEYAASGHRRRRLEVRRRRQVHRPGWRGSDQAIARKSREGWPSSCALPSPDSRAHRQKTKTPPKAGRRRLCYLEDPLNRVRIA